jgi:hypothetical protein
MQVSVSQALALSNIDARDESPRVRCVLQLHPDANILPRSRSRWLLRGVRVSHADDDRAFRRKFEQGGHCAEEAVLPRSPLGLGLRFVTEPRPTTPVAERGG